MKKLLCLKMAILLLAVTGQCQYAKYIKSETYSMTWYMLNDTGKIQIGTIQTRIEKGKKEVLIVQEIRRGNAAERWIDTAIADVKNLSPVYHSSFNRNRNMALRYSGGTVTGYYQPANTDKTVINDSIPLNVFDSNLYPFLLRWLDYKDSMRTISIYDYTNPQQHGVSTVKIISVVPGALMQNGNLVHAWKIAVADEISAGATSTYFVSQENRDLLKISIEAGPRKMEIIRN